MSGIIETCVTGANSLGRAFCGHAVGMSLQAGVLILVLLCVDWLLRRRVRATLRYWIWMLVFVKLLLPPSLSVPTGIGYWLGRCAPPVAAVPPQVRETTREPVYTEPVAPTEMPPRLASSPASAAIESLAPVERVATDFEPLTWQGGVFLLWAVGVLVFAGLVVQRLVFVRGLIAQAAPAGDDLTSVLDECRRRMGVRGAVGLRLSPNTFSPAVCGLFRPTILIPAELLGRLSPENLRAVLIHELAHVKRGDLWINSFQTVLQIVYFYNPLVWLANAIVRRVREQAVDEMVLVALGAEARSYSRTLIEIAEMAFLRVSPAQRLIGVAESRKSLEGRIRHMVTRPIPRTARIGFRGFLLVVAAGAVLVPMARAQRMMESVAQAGEHHVVAAPLTDFEHALVRQVLALAAQVQEKYPDKATHWPAGAGLYYVDSHGQVTVWHYRMLGRKAGCAEDEAGWGSSQLVDAEGMYYLPDGTPLSSRWRERDGGGMKDICIKVGRTVGEGERVALIHRHALNEEHDLWSRDGRKRTILVVAYDELPLGVAVRVDRPLRLASWWWGDVETDVRHLDGRDELLAMVPPRAKPGPLLVTVEFPAGMAVGKPAIAASQRPDKTAADRKQSAERLSALGNAALLYTITHEDRLPDRIEDLPDESALAKSWLAENVTYLGKHMRTYSEPDTPIAYDKTLLQAGQGTNVLYLDTRVVFEGPERLKTLGLTGVPPESRRQLEELGRALLIYASQHVHQYPDTLQDVRKYISERGDSSWMLANVTYLGKGGTPREQPGRILAYDKTLLREGQGTFVLYRDSHVEWVLADRLAARGIRSEP